jgi:hypothetical protein
VELHLHSPNTPPGCGALLKPGTTLYFTEFLLHVFSTLLGLHIQILQQQNDQTKCVTILITIIIIIITTTITFTIIINWTTS